jgi:insertion element IS1 protein InsB
MVKFYFYYSLISESDKRGLWSFVSNKTNKQWIWLALDVTTREIVGVYVGDRRERKKVGEFQSQQIFHRR